jgi:DNA gyrase subunit A
VSRDRHNGPDRYLLILTDDGYGKRLPLGEVPTRRAGPKGVRVSSEPVAAAIVVGGDGDLLVGSATGKVKRISVASVPIHRRRVQTGGRMSRGARVVELGASDRVCHVVGCPSAGMGR